LYLDTSALAALYIPEPLSDVVARVVGAKPPAISVLTEIEFSSAVARRVREKSISAADASEVLETFDAHIAERRYRHLPVAAQTFAEARRLLRSGLAPIPTLDAMHLALCALHREPLCTCDRQLARAAARFGVKVHAVPKLPGRRRT
jgi:hypothetical protein